MKALTLHQPWAQLLALGIKRIETRSWKTALRGPLVIHAGKSIDHYATQGFDSVWHQHGFCFADAHRFPPGAIVASCNLVDVVPIVHGKSPWDKRLPPICLVHVNDKMWHHVGPSAADVTDQLPYGDFTPGRFAWLLEDIQPVEQRCPACWGKGGEWTETYQSPFGGPPEREGAACGTCKGKGTCDPVPARGRQGLWTWNP